MPNTSVQDALKVPSNRPSLNLLAIFENVGRCQSLSRAAKELGVSQPAVSHAVARLEKELNEVLFVREHRGVSLTQTGKQLFDQITRPISDINAALDAQCQQQNNNNVTLCISTTFASYCLLPKIIHFKQANPEINIRCLTTDSDLNHPHEQADLTIPLGLGDWPNYQRWKLTDEAVFVVASPAYLNTHPPILNVNDLLQHSLLGLDTHSPQRMDWHQWLSHFGTECDFKPEQTSSNDYSVVIQSAIEGQGIALGWKHIVEPLIDDKRLAAVLPNVWVTDKPFYLVAPRYKKRSAATENLREWLIGSI